MKLNEMIKTNSALIMNLKANLDELDYILVQKNKYGQNSFQLQTLGIN